MRSYKTATCTSGDPVSASEVANSVITCFFRSAVTDIISSCVVARSNTCAEIENPERPQFTPGNLGERYRFAFGCREVNRLPVDLSSRFAGGALLHQSCVYGRANEDGIAASMAKRIRFRL